MEKYIVNLINKDLKWYEKIIVKIFKKTFVKVYNATRVDIVNHLL